MGPFSFGQADAGNAPARQQADVAGTPRASNMAAPLEAQTVLLEDMEGTWSLEPQTSTVSRAGDLALYFTCQILS